MQWKYDTHWRRFSQDLMLIDSELPQASINTMASELKSKSKLASAYILRSPSSYWANYHSSDHIILHGCCYAISCGHFVVPAKSIPPYF